MTTTVENHSCSDAKVLQSYLGGKWQAARSDGAPLVNPCDGTVLAWASSKGLDLKAALDYSRNVGGAELRKLTYAQRAELLGKIADLLATRRDEWYEIARKNSGNTKADAAIDVDGSIGTLKYFAKIGAKLGDAHMLRDGSPMRLARDQNFQGLHVGVPLDGVAVHINAFNFPAWGLWEKAAVSLLAGVPVLQQTGDFDGVAGAGDGACGDRGRHSAAGGVIHTVRLTQRSAGSSATGRCGRFYRLGGHGSGNSSAPAHSSAGRAREHRSRQPECRPARAGRSARFAVV